MPDEPRQFYPKGSAFEALLTRVYAEIWSIQDNPSLYAARVEQFASVWLPSMFQADVRKKIPDLEEKLLELDNTLNRL